MTVQELMDILSKLDPNKKVFVWNAHSMDFKNSVNEIKVDRDGDIIIL